MDYWFQCVMDFLNNASVAAFLGAFSAYFLVALTDWRRRRKRIELLVRRISINRDLATVKRETARTNIAMIRENRFTSAPVMRFPVEDVRALQREALDILSATQTNALDALVYWMEAIDGLFERARLCAEELVQLAKNNAPTPERSAKGEELLNEFRHAEINLGYFIELSTHYINSEPEKILEFRHRIG